jgi:integrase
MNENPRRERGSGSYWLVGKIWWIQFFSRGRRIRESSHSKKKSAAKKLLRQRLSEVNLKVYRSSAQLRYEDIRDAFANDYVMQQRRSLRFDSEGKPKALDKVKRLDRYFGGFHVEEIDSDALTRFKLGLQEQGKQNATINRSLAALRRMFWLAVEQEKLESRDVPHFEMLPEAPARKGFLEIPQYEALRAAMPDYLKPVLTIAFCTAMRSAEVRSIKWSQVDFLNGVIRLDAGQTKAKKARTVPIFGELKETLLEQFSRRRSDCEFVCYRVTKSGAAVRIGDFRKVWMDRCVKLELGRWVRAADSNGNPKFEKPRGPRSKAKPKMVYEGLLVHDLRRSGVRNLIRAGASETVARKISGHATRAIFDRYDITSDRDLQDAGEKLGTYLEKNGARTVQISESAAQRTVLPN